MTHTPKSAINLLSIYEWGLCIWSQRNVKFDSIPVKVPFPTKSHFRGEQPVAIASGLHFSAGLTQNGKIFVWGSTKGGRIHYSDCENISSPRMLFPNQNEKELDMVKFGALTCGISHGLVLERDGNTLWQFGAHSMRHGSGSLETHLHPVPDQPEKFSQVGIAAFAAGAWSNAAVLNDGSLYTWGYAQGGRLGIRTKDSHVDQPRRVSIRRKDTNEEVRFVDVTMGNNWCLARSDRDELWVTGNNIDSQLGIASKNKYVTNFTLVPKVRVQAIAASKSEKYGHSAALDANTGKLLMAGSNYKGKTGCGKDYKDVDHLREFTSIDTDFQVKKITFGGIHSVLLDTEGNAYSFGCGSDGRLGHEEAENYRYLFRELKPRRIETLKGRVEDISASYYHGVALVRE